MAPVDQPTAKVPLLLIPLPRQDPAPLRACLSDERLGTSSIRDLTFSTRDNKVPHDSSSLLDLTLLVHHPCRFMIPSLLLVYLGLVLRRYSLEEFTGLVPKDTFLFGERWGSYHVSSDHDDGIMSTIILYRDPSGAVGCCPWSMLALARGHGPRAQGHLPLRWVP
jgi:hypothetical protein